MAIRSVLAALLATLLLASCGGGGGGSSGASTSTPDSGGGSGAEIEGSWRGVLHQPGVAPFVVTATIRSLTDPALNTVHYAGIDCSGNWSYLGRRDSAYRFRERIDRGAGGDCKGVGTVTLLPFSADHLGYRFQGGGIQSLGDLRRTGS
jgi:hypothetical protein